MHALLIGSGSAGRRLMTALLTLYDNVRVTILRRAPSGDSFSEGISATVVSSLSDALLREPDLAIVATPSSAHIEVLPGLLSAGIATYVEKPVVATRADVAALSSLLDSLAVHPTTFSGCNLRFLPSLIALRREIQNGRVGRVCRVNMQAGRWLPEWRPGSDYRDSYSARSSLGGGVILDLIHELDLARWMFGEFCEVRAMAVHRSRLEIDTEDVACIILRGVDNGPIVSVNLDYVSRRPVRRYEVVGEQGSLIWDLDSSTVEFTDARSRIALEERPSEFNIPATYRAAMKAFLEAKETGSQGVQELVDGLRSVELALRAREAACI